jgi:predicted N-formylglutamate amidohydrolase
MLAALGAEAGLCMGDNEPYHGALEGDTLNVHGTRRGLPHALVEIRQDLISAQSGVDEWAERLARIMEPIMKDPILNEVKYFGGL